MVKFRPFVSGLLLFAIFLVGTLGIAWAVGAQYEAAPETTQTVTNETIVVDSSNGTTIDVPDHARVIHDNETITNSSGTTLAEGTDYEWHAATGTIDWRNTSAVTNGKPMHVDYAYTVKTEQARTARRLLAVPIDVILPAGVLVVAAMTIVGLAAGVYALVAGSRTSATDLTRR